MGDANNESGGSSSKRGQSWKYPKDLLQRLSGGGGNNNIGLVKREVEVEEGSDELELNLGLSLGGRFGVDKPHSNKLIRSSSIATTLPVIREPAADVSSFMAQTSSYPTIVRTSSLPAETEEEWRKRKELQTLRRSEAKRRRSEKQKGTNLNSNANTNAELSKEGMCLEDDRREIEGGGSGGLNLRDKQYMISALANYKSGSWVGRPFGLPNWANKSQGFDLSGGAGLLRANSGLAQPQQQWESQGSVESQGGSSSELESKSLQGTSSAGEVKSSGSNHSLEGKTNQEEAGGAEPQSNKKTCSTSASGSAENPSKRPDSRYKGKEVGGNGMGDMPCVFTTGDGPNGRRIDGILYKYGKGEEVRIMCVCHGIFLSPAEFVKHAGGTDVDHPLRHIVVNTSAASFS